MFWLGLTISLLGYGMGLAVLFFNRKKVANQLFCTFALGIATWILSIFVTIYVSPSLFWARMALASAILGAAFLMLFSIVFPEKPGLSSRRFWLLLGPALFFAAFSFTDMMVKSVAVVDGYITGEFGPLRFAHKFFPPIYIFSSVWILVKKYFRLGGVEKLQMKYVIWGVILSFVPAIITNGILPALGVYRLNGLGPLFVIFILIFISFVVLRHQFLDVKILIRTLEKKIEARTLELRHLYESQSQFLLDISHEIQTPLAILKGNLDTLAKKVEFDPGTFRSIEVMDKTLDRISLLVNNLLALARTDLGQESLAKKSVPLNNLLEDLCEDCQILAESKNIDLSFRNKSPILVWGDEEKLKVLFLNLLSNAFKYTSKGGKVTINSDGKNGHARIIVSDTGCGIGEGDLPHVFQRFYRSPSNNVDGGTGLGLAICKQIVESHGGDVAVRSKVGKGTDFIVSLPLSEIKNS